MSNNIIRQIQPNIEELAVFFERAFSACDLRQTEEFSGEDQTLQDWFAIDQLHAYLPNGALFEVRNEQKHLTAALFIGKQHPLTWPDGKKMEIFILAVDVTVRGQAIGSRLVDRSIQFAKKSGAHSIIVNTHESLLSVHQFYKKLGFVELGKLRNYYANGDAIFFQKMLDQQ